jgi:DNA-binding transcriptional LysR family regulator
MSMHPHIDIELRERPSGQIVRAIASGLADVGIVADAVDRAEGLDTFPFAVDQLVLITPARHPLARRRQIAFEEVLDCDFVGLAPDSALQAHINDHAACAARPLRLRVSLPSFDAICQVVESGIGVAIVPQLAAQRCRRSMAIRAVRLIDAWASAPAPLRQEFQIPSRPCSMACAASESSGKHFTLACLA